MYDTFLVVGGFTAGSAQAGQETNDGQPEAQAEPMVRDVLSHASASRPETAFPGEPRL